MCTLTIFAACSAEQKTVSLSLQNVSHEDTVNDGIPVDIDDAVATGEYTSLTIKEDASVTEKGVDITGNLVNFGTGGKKRSLQSIDTVIIHSVYNPFSGEKHSLEEILTIFEEYDVSPHYIINRDGEIFQTLDETIIAWHAGRSRVPDGRTNVNDFSIGIEMINSLDDTYTTPQYESLKNLLRDIEDRLEITYVLGHDEIKVEDPWNFEWSEINDFRHKPR